jgi:hypothetical protein
MTKKGEHAMQFAEYCCNWYWYKSRRHDHYMWHNAPAGWEPANEKFESIYTEDLYKRFLKHLKQNT